MKRRKSLALLTLSLAALLVNTWIFIWVRRGALFWGMGGTGASILAIVVALCGIMAFVIKPIPIKVSAITTLYLLFFSLLCDCVFSILGLLSDYFIILRNCAVIPPVLTFSLILYGSIHGKKTVLTRYRIASEHVKSPIKIALMSDIHMGLSVDEKRLQTASDSLSAEHPDLLVIAGDLVDDQTTPEQMEAACRIIGGVKTSLGIWFVYGNHDVAAVGPKLKFSQEQYRKALADNGINILEDTCAVLEDTATLAGRLDAWNDEASKRMELNQLLRDTNPSLPIILIDHQPLDINEAIKAGVLLQLSGHTHGGQIWPAGVLSTLYRPKSVVYGHRCIDGFHVIVSSGLGTRGSGLRSGCTSETVIIDMLPE